MDATFIAGFYGNEEQWATFLPRWEQAFRPAAAAVAHERATVEKPIDTTATGAASTDSTGMRIYGDDRRCEI